MKSFDNITRIQVLNDLLEQELHDLGLSDLTPSQRDVYFAAWMGSNAQGEVTSVAMRSHRGLARMPTATFHRCLKALVDLNFLSRPYGSKAKKFIVNVSSGKSGNRLSQ
ncbi:hypothetical protein [Pseudogemmobacter sp. W21_MBD1_M6]|uniref:hypothetical protein n=1 Tax=Pseudogemmobacter sp. W21_MBD1_M6 TaxID=3240271 RepID=UPI003F9A9EEF